MQTVYLKPPKPARVLGEYDVDYLALELDDDGNVEDLRLEIGTGWSNFALVPITPNGRTRLFCLERVITCDQDPELIDEDCGADYCESWNGELAKVGAGGVLEEVQLTMTSKPSSYRCAATVRRSDGSHAHFELRYG